MVLCFIVVACGGEETSATPRPGGPAPGRDIGYVRSLCPAESVDACVRAYEAAEEAGPEAVLCILPGGRWSIESPRLDGPGPGVGDPCGEESSGTVRAVINAEVYAIETVPRALLPRASAEPSRAPEPSRPTV